MKQKLSFILFTIFFILPGQLFADGWVTGLDETDLRNGNINIDDIPKVIMSAINFFMSFAGWIAVIMIIIGAYQILFGSLSSDKSKGKRTIYLALSGFALASLSWLIVKFIIDNYS